MNVLQLKPYYIPKTPDWFNDLALIESIPPGLRSIIFYGIIIAILFFVLRLIAPRAKLNARYWKGLLMKLISAVYLVYTAWQLFHGNIDMTTFSPMQLITTSVGRIVILQGVIGIALFIKSVSQIINGISSVSSHKQQRRMQQKTAKNNLKTSQLRQKQAQAKDNRIPKQKAPAKQQKQATDQAPKPPKEPKEPQNNSRKQDIDYYL